MAAAADNRFSLSPVNRKPLSDDALNLSPASVLDRDFEIILPTSDSSGHLHAAPFLPTNYDNASLKWVL
jgi:hypothetical protein